MHQELSKHITEKFPFLKDKKLLVAISGGLDSVVLTHLLSTLNFKIALAHCNFKLRAQESDLDETFVKNLASELQLEVFTISFETEKIAKQNKQSTQVTARDLRYNWFKELVEEYNFDFVLTAHHADDNLETFLINLTRGTGLEGLTGIPERNKNIVRPLLKFSRLEILAYAKANNIDWREDKSNASSKYVRNKIRHQIVPILKEINPSLLESFGNTAKYLQQSELLIKDGVAKVSSKITSQEKNTLKFNIEEIVKLSNPKAYLYQLLKTYHFKEWNDVYNLLTAQSGKQVLSKTHVLLKDRDFLILSKKDALHKAVPSVIIQNNTQEIETPIGLKFQEVLQVNTTNKNTVFVNKNALVYPLKLRKWQNGDYFYPSKMKGKKKLSKYFKDIKLSLLEKQNTWLLCNNDNAIIWVVGLRQDNRFMVSKTSTSILKMEYYSFS